jgi:23S rRNA (adenine2503-C2)-methyltransferase
VRLVPQDSSSFNTKFAVELDDGAVVEAVVYRRHTLCVSSQVGCAVGCPFCASGRRGLLRNLTLDEMVAQVEQARPFEPSLQRITISGVGEPLHNAATVEAFLHWCRKQSLAPSLTTSGGTADKLRHFIDLPHNGLTVSVHAGSEPMRRKLVPHGPTLASVLDTVESAFPKLSRSRRRRLSLAYLLLEGWNDDPNETRAFAERARGIGASVYLYRLNPVAGSAFQPAREERYQQVVTAWRSAGLEVRRSSLARTEDNGGCGTLVAGRSTPPESRAARA